MTRTAQPADVRRTLRALMAASAWMLAFLVLAPATAAAAPATSSGVTDGTLRISGGSSSDAIVLRLSPADPNQLQIDFGDDGSADETFSISTFQAIEVIGGHGDDTVRIDQANGAFTTTKTTRIDGGNGDDILLGGSGAETLSGGNGDDVVDGNGGADVGDLGRGDDVFVWDPGDGSDVVEGRPRRRHDGLQRRRWGRGHGRNVRRRSCALHAAARVDRDGSR